MKGFIVKSNKTSKQNDSEKQAHHLKTRQEISLKEISVIIRNRPISEKSKNYDAFQLLNEDK